MQQVGSPTNRNTVSAAAKKAGLISFVFVMYSYCTGGPFGLEDMVTTSGPGMSLIFLMAVPFFWCIPMSLVAAELTTAMPVEGGFYRWTRAAFGDFWGFLAGWWNWCSSFLLGAVYAVLFTDYITFFYPQITGWKQYLVALFVIALISYVNILGIAMVGTVATVLEILNPAAGNRHVRNEYQAVASQSVCAADPAASAHFPNLRGRLGNCVVVVCRLRAGFHSRRRSGKPAQELSASFGVDGANFHRHLFPS